MANIDPKLIYRTVQSEVGKLLASLVTDSDDEELKTAQQDAQKQLTGIHQEMDDAILSLEKNAEWDVFSIAFYGETNAGKSTLIETLRILLGEPSKRKEREGFSQIADAAEKIQKSITANKNLLEGMLAECQNQIDSIKCIIDDNVRKRAAYLNEVDGLAATIIGIRAQICTLKKRSVVFFIKALLKKTREHADIRKIEHRIQALKYETKKVQASIDEQNLLCIEIQENSNKNLQALTNKIEASQQELTQKQQMLRLYADGKIIGDGHSDFTRVVTEYQFESNGQKFALLDLPGIEGKEELVLSAITDAVQKAHAVFYISGKPTPPQTGDADNGGTLGKIKRHLGQQTEVYAIFNKRAKNPEQLHPGVIDADERQSLQDLDSVMKTFLGEQYSRHVVLSAYPGFLSLANCWQSEFQKSQQKFLDAFETQSQLLQSSRVQEFSDWLKCELLKDCQGKIRKSNMKKVRIILSKSCAAIDDIYQKMDLLYEKLLANKKSTDRQLENAVEGANRGFSSELTKSIDKFQSGFRTKIYGDVNKEINGKEFESAFKKRQVEAMEELGGMLQSNFGKVLTEFSEETENILKKYQQYAAELIEAFERTEQFEFNFTPKIDIKSGINWAGTITSVIGSIVGIILCITNPAGWVVLALSILGAVISIGKGILGFLNHDYRASQQRKVADENIEAICDKIKESVQGNLKEANKKLSESIDDIKKNLQKSLRTLNEQNCTFLSANNQFQSLIRTIDTQGA